MVRFLLLALALFKVQSALAAAVASVARSPTVRCGNEDPPVELLAQADRFRKTAYLRELAFGGSISVNAYFHVVNSAGKNGSVTSSQLSSQV